MTAARAAGMPVRRPRRPAAASAADAETDLELSCGAVENGAQTLLAAFARRRGDFAGRGDALAHARRRRAARVWVALAAAPQPGHRTPRLSSPRPLLSSRGIFVSGLVCVRRSVCGCASVRLLAQFLRRGTPLFFPSVLSFVLVCARAVMGSAGVVLASVSASASAGSSGGCCWWERSRAHARVLSSAGSPWRACGDARCGVGCGASRLGGPRIPTADGRGSIDRSA